MQNTKPIDERLTLNEVAKYLKVHVATVHRWIFQGVRGKRLTSFLVGGRRFIAISDLEDFLQAKSPSGPNDSVLRFRSSQEKLGSYGIGHPDRGEK
jgi:excisionase family DNA binding protein